jgi:hypothetical protein
LDAAVKLVAFMILGNKPLSRDGLGRSREGDRLDADETPAPAFSVGGSSVGLLGRAQARQLTLWS